MHWLNYLTLLPVIVVVETTLIHMIDSWLHTIDDGQMIGVVFVDFKKAFDLVDHQILLSKIVSEYDQESHNHKPQTTPWHREEEPLNHHETPGRQIKQSNQLSLPHQDDCNTRMGTKQRTTKHRTITDSHNWSNNKQKVNNNRTTALERTAAQATGGLKRTHWYHIFALDSAVVEVQEIFSSHGGHLTNAMYHHGETLIKLTHHDETRKRAHDSKIVRAKEYLKLSHGGSSYR